MTILTIRTTVGRERTVLETLTTKVHMKPVDVKAILAPAELKGYLFIEGSEEGITDVLRGVPHVRGLINKPVAIEQLETFMKVASKEITMKVTDIVEVIGGPFKHEKAKIVRIDEDKREARIELIESAVPIPITIKLDLLKVIK